MVFSSTLFLFLFLPITLAGYFLLQKRLRNVFLLLMSLLFYAVGEPSFVWVMIGSIAVNYGMGLAVWKTADKAKWLKRTVLIAAVAANLALLFYYKYLDFAIGNLNGLFGTNIALRNIALPIGISFFTFQGMSYVIDVYMQTTEVQKNPLNVALYVALFPQLIAGPIVRYHDINEEIDNRSVTWEDFGQGVQRFAIGLAKKIILSNNFALLADQTFNEAPATLGAGMAWLGAIAYAFQIYFDFSGYSDMAIGLGRMFGFHFLENFDHPYTSTNVTIFWRKWHISLSSWFRDYVYIPLGGNRRGNVYVNLFIVFLLTGIWHGASWNFVVWGLWHGLFLIVERILKKKKISLPIPRCFKWLYTMLVVLVGWVFFRAADLSAALRYLQCMIGLGGSDAPNAVWYALQEYGVTLLLGVLCAAPAFLLYQSLKKRSPKWERTFEILQPVFCVVLLVFGITFTVTSTYNPFIYFNF